MRGSRDPSEQSLERARENGMEKDVGESDGKEGRAGIYGRREKRRGSATCTFPN